MTNAKKIIIGISSAILVGLGGFGIYKYMKKLKKDNEGKDLEKKDELSVLESFVGKQNGNDENGGVVPNVNKEVEEVISTIAKETNSSYTSAVKPTSYSSQGNSGNSDNGLNSQGYDKGLDLYHRIISTCATLRESKTGEQASMLREYALKGGLQGKTFSGICYKALKDMYGDNPNYDDAMALIGDKEQFRKDLKQYIEQGTYRI